MFLLTEFWFFFQSVLIIIVDNNIFFLAIYYIFSNIFFWSDFSCQIFGIWVKIKSVSHSNTNQAEKWMFLFSALKSELHNKYQILFADIYSECLSFWLQNFWKISFYSSVFLIMLSIKWLLCELMLIWWLHCRFDVHWWRWHFRWKSWCRWECWFEFSFCSALFSHAHFIITLSSIRFLIFELTW